MIRWCLSHRDENNICEYAIHNNTKIFVIRHGKDRGYILYDMKPLVRMVWEFDNLEQARKEAEIRYANKGAYTLSY